MTDPQDRLSDASQENKQPQALDIGQQDDHKLSESEKLREIDAAIAREDLALGSFSHLDIKKILLKIDFRLVTMLTILYLLSFLDRGNIGNAAIEGLREDLNLTGPQYSFCLGGALSGRYRISCHFGLDAIW